MPSTTNLSSLDVSNIVSTIRIYNEYFNLTDTKFTRDQSINDYDNFWDMSSSSWADHIISLSNGNVGTNKTYTVDHLTFNSGTYAQSANYLKSGTNTDGTYIQIGRYDRENRTNSITFSFTHEVNSTVTKRQGHLRIYASNPTNSESDTGVDLSITGTNISNIIDVTGGNYTNKSMKEWTFDVPVTKNTVSLTVIPSENNTKVNIYRIEYELSPINN